MSEPARFPVRMLPSSLRLPSSIARPMPAGPGPRDALKAAARRMLAAVMALAVAAQSQPAFAQGAPKLPLIRDAEIENLLRDYASPIFAAAGLSRGAIQIVILGDRSFNAF